MTHIDPQGTQETEQYILLPPRGIRTTQAVHRSFFGSLPRARSTGPSEAATLRYSRPVLGPPGGFDIRYDPTLMEAPFDAPYIPIRVVDSIHEDGPKLIEATESAAFKLRLAAPFARLVPNRDYRPQQPSPSLPLAPPSGAASAPPVAIEICGRPGRVPIAGIEVLVITDVAGNLGAQGITDARGRVELRLGPGPVRAERLHVEPPASGYWGAFRAPVVLSAHTGIALDAISLAQPDALRHHCAAVPRGRDGDGVRVAVIDTGIDLTHPDLTVAGGANTVTGEQSGDYGDNGIGHGSHVAGIIAAAGSPPHGVRGLAPAAELMSYRVYGQDSRTAKTYAITKALISAVEGGCHLINLSLGALPQDEALKDAIDDAADQGVVVIAAAGNDYRKSVSVPACYATAVSAFGRTGTFPPGAREQGDVDIPAGSDPADFVAAFSNIGSEVYFIAPGVGIVSTVPGGYAPGRGTSMAAAAATGMAARLLSARPDLLTLPPDHSRSAAIKHYLGTAARSMGFGLAYEGYGML
jgi:hypothetical protein